MTLCVNRSNVLVMFNLCFHVQVHVYLYSWGLRMRRAQPKSPQHLIYKLCTVYIECRGKQALRHSIITTSYRQVGVVLGGIPCSLFSMGGAKFFFLFYLGLTCIMFCQLLSESFEFF